MLGREDQQSLTWLPGPFEFHVDRTGEEKLTECLLQTCSLFPKNLSLKLLLENTHLCLLNKR